VQVTGRPAPNSDATDVADFTDMVDSSAFADSTEPGAAGGVAASGSASQF